MNTEYIKPNMNQKIFTLNLSVETVSIYLSCCGLADINETVTAKKLASVWNGTPESMNKSLEELENKNIVIKILSDNKDNHAYKINEAHEWNE